MSTVRTIALLKAAFAASAACSMSLASALSCPHGARSIVSLLRPLAARPGNEKAPPSLSSLSGRQPVSSLGLTQFLTPFPQTVWETSVPHHTHPLDPLKLLR